MSIELVFGVWTQRWISLGLSDLSLWLQGRPWSGQGSLLVARVPHRNAEHGRTMVEKELRTLFGGEVWLVELEAAKGQRLQDLLHSWSGIEISSLRNLSEVLRPIFEFQNRLFFVNLPDDTAIEGWLDDARSFLDRLSKVGPGTALGLLAFVGSGRDNTTRLDLAWPLHTVCTGQSSSWGAYLHERIAWYSGGNIDTADEVAQTVATIRVNQDNVLESALDEHSQRCLAHLPPQMLSMASVNAVQASASASLLLHPMIPGAGNLLRPVPWFARAVLLKWPDHPQRSLLHTTITCRPLAARLLGRLIDLEGHLRDQLIRSKRLPPPPEDLERRFRQAAATYSFDRLLDPLHRRPMGSAWDIAGYGDLLQLLPPGDTCQRALNDARQLRNALAHGSAVSWNAIQKVEELESSLRDVLPSGKS